MMSRSRYFINKINYNQAIYCTKLLVIEPLVYLTGRLFFSKIERTMGEGECKWIKS